MFGEKRRGEGQAKTISYFNGRCNQSFSPPSFPIDIDRRRARAHDDTFEIDACLPTSIGLPSLSQLFDHHFLATLYRYAILSSLSDVLRARLVHIRGKGEFNRNAHSLAELQGLRMNFIHT